MAKYSKGMQADGTLSSTENVEYDYVKRYIAEAIDNRTKLVEWTSRAIQAYQGYPSKDGYISSVESYSKSFVKEDNERAKEIERRCKSIKPRKSMIIGKSIDSMVAQAMGGVGQYECSPYDPHFAKDPELIDLLDEAAMNFYNDNHVDSIIAPAIEFAGLSGSVYAYLGYRLDKSKDNGDIDIQLIPSTEMLIDPLRSKRNRDRYIGFQTQESWSELKEHLIEGKHSDDYMLKSVNNVETYLSNVEAYVNKNYGEFTAGHRSTGAENLPKGLDQFFKASATVWAERNKEYLAKTDNSQLMEDELRYRANDVEVIYLYDLDNRLLFTVVNREFIVGVDSKYLSGSVEYSYPVVDPYSGVSTEANGHKKISLDHPFVPLEYKRSLWQTYPYSPIVDVLDLFDDIVAIESLIYHTISIMTPITFTGNPKDIEKLGAIAGVSGETIKGFIANSVTVLNKAVDLTPALSEISRLENAIADKLNGLDVREQSRMIGDRASAAEAMGVASLVSQGLNSLLANIERFAEELATKMFKLTVIYEDDDFEYNFSRAGSMKSLSRTDLAGDFRIRAKLKSKIKAEQQAQMASTLQWFVPLMGSDAIKDKEAFAQSIIPTLANGFSRKTVSSWFEESEQAKMAQQAQIQAAQEAAEASRAVADRERGVDMSMVDPSNAGEFGHVDIASALGGNTEPGALDMSAEDSPLGGARKPGPTSRSLNYGIGSGEPEPLGFPVGEVTGVNYGQNSPIDGEEEAIEDAATEMSLHPLETPESGGYNANNPFTGANAPDGFGRGGF